MVVGDMRELGEHADAFHAPDRGGRSPRGRSICSSASGELGRYIALGAAGGGLAAVAFDTVEEACRASCPVC